MSINSPSDLQPTLEDIKNQITDSEAEVLRLRELKQSHGYEITEQIKLKKWHEEEIEKLGVELDDLQIKLGDHAQEFTDAKALVENAAIIKREQDGREKDIEINRKEALLGIEKTRSEKLLELERREESLKQRESDQDELELQFNERRTEIGKKSAVALDAIAALQKSL